MSERGESTRQRLLDAAARVIVERGYARATTKEIAKAAGVAEGTIYRHFADKRELFRAVFLNRNAANAEAIVGLPLLAGTKTVRENLHFLIRALEDVERHVAPLRAAFAVDEELAASLFSQGGSGHPGGSGLAPLGPLAEYLEAEQKLGRVRSGIDTTRAAFALFAIPFAAVITGRMARAAGVASEVDMVGAVDVVLAGLEPTPGGGKGSGRGTDSQGDSPVIVRPESPGDIEAIERVNVEAFADHPFGQQTEHLIVAALRAAGALDVSLVAEVDREVVGHIAFSQARIGESSPGWFLLGPVAVLPAFQARGIGRTLIEAGLEGLRSRGAHGSVLVGDPAFYARFGFARAPGVTYPGVPDENVVCLRFSGPQPVGRVSAHPAFEVGLE